MADEPIAQVISTMLDTLQSQQARLNSLDAVIRTLIEAHSVHAEALASVLSTLPPETSLPLGDEAREIRAMSPHELRAQLRIVSPMYGRDQE